MEIEKERIQRPVAQTCPECGGAMREETFGTLKAFRCHIGHTMTADVLALAQLYALESAFGTVLRSLNERWALCCEIAAERDGQGRTEERDRWRAAAKEALAREDAVRKLAEAGLMNPQAATTPALDA